MAESIPLHQWVRFVREELGKVPKPTESQALFEVREIVIEFAVTAAKKTAGGGEIEAYVVTGSLTREHEKETAARVTMTIIPRTSKGLPLPLGDPHHKTDFGD